MRVFPWILAGVAVTALAASDVGRPEVAPPAAPTVDRLLSSGDGIDHAALDPTVDPCSDFYAHACGGFIARHPASPERPTIGLAEEQFNAALNKGLDRILHDEAARDLELRRLQTFDASCRGGTAGDARLVRHWLDRIDGVKDREGIRRMTRALAAIGVDAFVNFGGRPDRTDPDHYRGEIHPGILFADPAPVTQALRTTGESADQARRRAEAIGAMVADLRKLRNDRWDASSAENPRSQRQLEALAPAFGWTAYLQQAGAAPGRPVNVTSIRYLEALDRTLKTQPVEVLRDYLKWAFLFSLRNELPAPYSDSFAGLAPNLRPEIRDIDTRCKNATVRAMGVEFSRQYSMRILGVPARDTARHLSDTIKDEIAQSIAEDRWLSPDARLKTADKLRRTKLKIGFPDHWPSVGHYPLERDRFLANVLAARRFEQQREWRRAHEARTRSDWEVKVSPWIGEGMAASRLVIPNGFPDAFTNSLIMTAAFLSSPRFAIDAGPELNAATYGSVFAHEFVHVAQLHMYGPTGRDEELWTAADEKAGDVQGQCVVDQANAYEALPGVHLPGKDMFDENVADYGGARLAYRALQKKLGAKIDVRDATGTSPAQRFFYRFAQYRCTSQTEEELRSSIANDGHAPPAFRVNAPLMNMPEFARAFSCKARAPMTRPANRQCRVW